MKFKSFYEFLEQLRHYQWVTMDSPRLSGPNKVDMTPDPHADPFAGTHPSDYVPPTRQLKPDPKLDAALARFNTPPQQNRRFKKKK